MIHIDIAWLLKAIEDLRQIADDFEIEVPSGNEEIARLREIADALEYAAINSRETK